MEDQPDTMVPVVAFLRGRDVPCPGCKYNLRDLESAVCPECGEALTVGLQAERPRLAGLVLGLLPIAMTLGFFGIYTVLVVAFSVWWSHWPSLILLG